LKIEELSKKTKTCIHCKIPKTDSEFYHRKNSVSNICILCRRIYYAAYKKKSRLTKVVQNTGEKICKDCQLKKSRKQFPIARTYKDGRDCRCNSCRKKKISTYKNSWISKRVGYANNSRKIGRAHV
jgi:hypothetical protein